MTLLLPWIDAKKSYRGVYQTMKSALPPAFGCVASRGLGESERAMLDYVLGIRTVRQEAAPFVRCSVFLVQYMNGSVVTPPDGMELAWSGSRPGDSREKFNLYVLAPKAPTYALR